MILLLDNRDSFTFNLEHALQALGAEVQTVRSTDLDPSQALELGSAGILIGPGPGTPQGAGCIEALVQRLLDPEHPPVPTLGVCLGHQGIAHRLGGNVVRAPEIVHGKTSPVRHDGTGLFAGVPNPVDVMRYHSLVVERQSLPTVLRVTAETVDTGLVMAFAHREWPMIGVQFHPESIGTPTGQTMMRNFLEAR